MGNYLKIQSMTIEINEYLDLISTTNNISE